MDILFEEIPAKQGSIGLITLNRPKALNALNHDMFKALHHHLMVWQGQPSINAVIIRAVPGKAFCAGGDVKLVYEEKLKNNPNMRHFFIDEYKVDRLIYHYPKPYIALLDGITMGGGAGISIHGSHRIATEKMTFAMPETAIGFYPDIGASYFLSRIPYKIGMYLGLTGDSIPYQDAFALGLVNHVISHQSQDELIQALQKADVLGRHSVTEIINQFAVGVPPSDLLHKKEEIETCFSHHSVEKILEALNMSSDWCKSVAKNLLTKSPTSLKVTFEAILQGEHLDFDACMDMEQHITFQFFNSHDFFEGVRALLVDKDKKPKWQPADLKDVSESAVLSYFNKNEKVSP